MLKKINSSIIKLNSYGFKKVKAKPYANRYNYNCWGFVARLNGWIKKLRWIEEDEMVHYLSENTVVVKSPRIGDIVCYHDSVGLAHCAVFVEHKGRKILHKPGADEMEVITMSDNIKNNRKYFGEFKEYRRIKEKKS